MYKVPVMVQMDEVKLQQVLARPLEGRLRAVGVELERYCKQFISRAQPRHINPKTGIYEAGTREDPEGTRDPSRPGEPPKILTGVLRASIGFEVHRGRDPFLLFGVRRGRAGGKGKSETEADSYARALELGDPGRHLAPRPYLRPTVKHNWQKIKQMLGAK